MVSWADFPRLHTLYLTGNQLTTLEGMPNLPELQKLVAWDNQLTTFEGLPNLPNLRKLHLAENPELNDPKRIQELRDKGVIVYT